MLVLRLSSPALCVPEIVFSGAFGKRGGCKDTDALTILGLNAISTKELQEKARGQHGGDAEREMVRNPFDSMCALLPLLRFQIRISPIPFWTITPNSCLVTLCVYDVVCFTTFVPEVSDYKGPDG